MKKAIIHEFDPVLYPVKLYISITKNISWVNEKFCYYPLLKNIDFDDSGEATTQLVKNKETGNIGVLIIFENKKQCTAKNIAHESTHAARRIWDRISENATGEEADAYLVGWIAECCWKVKLNKF